MMNMGSALPDTEQIFISYSTNGEDVLLWRIFAERSGGFFVDVGAEDPVGGNDFYALYEHFGWRGINVEPNPEWITKLLARRPEDRNLQALLSDKAGEKLAFFVVEGTGLSTCDAERASAYAADGKKVSCL